MRIRLTALLCLYATLAVAAMQIQTIQLQGRSAEEIIPILQPMLAPGGSLSGTGYKLIVKSTPENIAQLRDLLAEIDSPPAQLLISVSNDVAVLQDTQKHAGRITITQPETATKVVIGDVPEHATGGEIQGGNDRIRVEGKATQQYGTNREPLTQQVRVTEGLWAAIQYGEAIPYATRSVNPDGTVTESVTYEPITSGFRVLPRLSGEMVTLSIKPDRKSTGPQPGGAYNITGVETTLRAKLGEWVEIGNTNQNTTSSTQGIGYGQQTRGGERQRIFVKIERVAQ